MDKRLRLLARLARRLGYQASPSESGLLISRPLSIEEWVCSVGREAALERYREAVLLRPGPTEDAR